MRCPHCSREMQHAAFCKWCGTAQHETVAPAARRPTGPPAPPIRRVASRTVPAKGGVGVGATLAGVTPPPLPPPPTVAPEPSTSFPQTVQAGWQPPPPIATPVDAAASQPTVLATISSEVPVVPQPAQSGVSPQPNPPLVVPEVAVPEVAAPAPATARPPRPPLATEETPGVAPTAGAAVLATARVRPLAWLGGLKDRLLGWPRPLLIGLLVGAPSLILGGIVTLLLLLSGPEPGAVPLDAHRLPPTTDRVAVGRLSLPDVADPKVRSLHRAALLGSTFCAPDRGNPWYQYSFASLSSIARRLGDEQRKQTAELLACGARMASQIDGDVGGGLSFKGDDDKKKLRVRFMSLDGDELSLPATAGWLTRSFSGLAGHCHGGTAETCDDKRSTAVLVHEGKVYWGTLPAIEKLAPHLAQPAEELSTGIEALQLAASHTSGLSERRLAVNPKSTKQALLRFCRVGARLSGYRLEPELCFPAELDKRLEAHDAMLRAESFDQQATLEGAERLRLGLTLVARDAEAAEALGKTLTDFVRDWRAHLANNAAKIAKTVAEEPKTRQEKRYKALVTAYVRGLAGIEVERDGRAVLLRVDTSLTDAERREAREAVAGDSSERRTVQIAGLLAAIQAGEAPPTRILAALTKDAVARSIKRAAKAAARHFDSQRRRARYGYGSGYRRYRRYGRHAAPPAPPAFPRSADPDGGWLDGKAFHTGNAGWLGYGVQPEDLALYKWRYRAVGVGGSASYTLEARLSHAGGGHTTYRFAGTVDENLRVVDGKVVEVADK